MNVKKNDSLSGRHVSEVKFDEFNLETERFSLEHLLDSEENVALIEQFSAPNNAAGLENYLKYSAFDDEKRNYGRTYLVKDKSTGEIVCYFSLRTGLITMQVSDAPERFETIPAIELSNFAVDTRYRERHTIAKKIGFLMFNYFIMPLVREIAKYVGVNSLYIYALPNERLIGHYKTMGFCRLSPEDERFVQKHVKPEYDEGCIFMYQTV